MKFDIQKADFWKRLSALMFDVLLLFMVAVGVAALLSSCLSYNKHAQAMVDIEAEYAEKYNVNFDITPEEYEKLSKEEKDVFDVANAEFEKDERAIYAYNMLINLTLISLTMSLLVSFILLELVVPIFFKHGRTLGKKIFGLAVIRTNGVRMSGQAHFIRSIIGKYTMETMVPIYILLMILFGDLGFIGTIMLVLMLGLEIFTVCYTKTRSAIHDLVSDTVVVDMASQMIFESEEELVAYKTALHEEEVRKADY